MLKVFEDTFESLGSKWEGAAEISIDTEISIPDYQPPVFKIVKAFIQPVILQKNASGARLHLEGYLRCVVLYQPETEGNLCRTEQKYPFERTLDLPDDTFSGGIIETIGNQEYLNCRAVNQRRIEIRGTYIVSCRMTGRQPLNLITALADEGIEQRMEKIACSRLVGNLDKLITSEEEIRLSEGLQSILDISGTSRILEKKLLGGKAILKGSTECRILYTVPDTEQLQQQSVSVPFNQIVDIDSLKEESCCAVQAETIGCTVTSGSEGSSILTVTTMLRMAVYNPYSLEAVADCFSTRLHTENESCSFSSETVLAEWSRDAAFKSNALLPGSDCVPLGCLCQVQAPSLSASEHGTHMDGFVLVSLLYRNSLQEYACMDTTVPYHFDLEAEPGSRFSGSVQVQNVSYRKNDATVEISVTVTVDGILTATRESTLVSKVTTGEAWSNSDEIALRIYYGHAGENVFDIAKKFHAKPRELTASNKLQADILPNNQHILIPSAY